MGKWVNPTFEFHLTGGIKMKSLTTLANILNKEVT